MATSANENRETTTIKILEVTKVTPLATNSNSTTTTSFTLPLTYFDIFWFKVPPVERLFFYETTELTRPDSEIIPKLKHSFSLTLLHYLPLAGRIMWPSDAPKPAVYYYSSNNQNDDDVGVSFTVAESSSSSDLFNHGIRKAVEYHPLVPKLSITDEKANVIAVQVTLFPNQGFSIGITSHHAILDGRSSTLFVKSWAYLCKQLQLCHRDRDHPSLPPELTPFFDRSAIKDPKGQDMVEVNKWLVNSANKRSLKFSPLSDSMESLNKLVRVTVELTREDIKKLRDKIISDELISNSKQQLHLSTFVVTLAYVFVCIVKAMAKIEGDLINKNVVVGFTADYRTRLDPPVPVNYIGNCNGRHVEAAKASDLIQENGLAFLAETCSDMVKRIDEDISKPSEDKFVELLKIMQQGALTFNAAGSTGFDVYGSDFGWGKPKKVEMVSIDRTKSISLADRRDGGGGAEVGVVLEKQLMEVFISLFSDGLKS